MNRCSIKINLLSALSMTLLLSFASVQAQVLTPRYNTSMGANTNGYYEYLPQGYSSTGSTLHPLLIFVHGMHEYGNGGAAELGRVLKHGPSKLIKAGTFPTSFTVNGKTFKFVILSPQFKAGVSPSHIGGIIDYAISHYKVDPKRIYLTGLSAGGGAIENVAADGTVGKRVAALVAFAGNGSSSAAKAATIVNNNVAFWGIHNMYDNVVSSSKTINYVNYILGAKSTANAKKTITGMGGGASHDCWTPRFVDTWRENGMNIYEWMLQYQRSTTTNTPPVANAGSDKTITLPTTSVQLLGSGTDANGTISKYSWTKVSGPSTYILSSASVAAPSVSALVTGTYTFRLTVTDNGGATDYDDVNVIVDPLLTTTYSVPGTVQAEDYNAMLGVEKQLTSDAGGGQNVSNIDQGNWIDYSVEANHAGAYTVTFRVASPNSGAQLQLKNRTGFVLATAAIPNTGGWQTWKNVTATVNLAAGAQTLRLYSVNATGWNINYMDFESVASSATEPAAAKVEAENYSSMAGVRTQTTEDVNGGRNVSYIDQGDWMAYNITAATAGTYTFVFRVASPNAGSQFNVLNASGTRLATVAVPNTGGWQTWKNVTATVTLPAGSQTIKLSSSAASGWNINYFTYASAAASATALAATSVTEETTTKTNAAGITPNPFADRFVLTVNNELTGVLHVQLIDAGGAVRKEFKVLKNTAGTVQNYLSAGALPAGVYFIKMQMGAWSQSKQIVKL